MNDRMTSELDELAGYSELGMQRECLAFARKLLKATPIVAMTFIECVQMILIHADRLKPWRKLVESAFNRLDEALQKRAARKVFHFYVSVEDWKAALEFLPSRTNEPLDLVFSMWTLLNLQETQKAKPIYRKCRTLLRRLAQTENDSDEIQFAESSLREAAACYLAQTKRWDEAEEMWELGSTLWPFGRNAWEGLVKLHALRAFLEANNVFTVLRHDDYWLEQSPIALPNNQRDIRWEVNKTFHYYARHLAKVIPAKERSDFGL